VYKIEIYNLQCRIIYGTLEAIDKTLKDFEFEIRLSYSKPLDFFSRDA